MPKKEDKINETIKKEDKKFKQSDDKKKTDTIKEKLYKVVFKENRPFQLPIGRELLHFQPNGINPWFPEKYKDGLPESIINHKDFQSCKKYFNIMEVN